MSKKDESLGSLRCSFCGKSQKEVKKLIAGPGVYICDECVNVCNDIAQEDQVYDKESAPRVLTPTEIKNFLDEYVLVFQVCVLSLVCGQSSWNPLRQFHLAGELAPLNNVVLCE